MPHWCNTCAWVGEHFNQFLAARRRQSRYLGNISGVDWTAAEAKTVPPPRRGLVPSARKHARRGREEVVGGGDVRGRRARREAGCPGAMESAQTDGGGVLLASVLARYTEVGLRYKAEKVRDYSAEQDLFGHTLDWNVLRGSLSRYHTLAQAVRPLERRMWAQPREVKRMVGRFTHWFLLHRPALSIFNAVYAFASKVG